SGEEGPVWSITQDDRMIGVIGLDDIVGYYLQSESWGRGLMSEALAAVVSWRFSLGDLECIGS
ncbi:MAG: GNAT family N-acetyltransferase, partial [Pseudomonadota bacterium]